MKKKVSSREKVLKHQVEAELESKRDRINIMLEQLGENTSDILGAFAGTEVAQAILWYLISSSNTKIGDAMSMANKLILVGELIPTIDLPKGAVLGALLDQGDDILKTVLEVKEDIVEAVEDIEEKAQVFTGKWWRTHITRAECVKYKDVVWESEGKPYTTEAARIGKGFPLYETFVSEPILYKGNDSADTIGIPAVCVLRNEETGNKKIVAQIVEP